MKEKLLINLKILKYYKWLQNNWSQIKFLKNSHLNKENNIKKSKKTVLTYKRHRSRLSKNNFSLDFQ